MPENPSQIIEEPQATTALNGSCSSSTSSTSNGGTSSSTVFASLFASSTASGSLQPPPQPPPAFTDLIRAMSRPDRPSELSGPSCSEPISLCLSSSNGSSIFGTGGQERRQYAPPPQPAMSATALLQKAAQMGAAATNASLLRGFGIVPSSSSSPSLSLQDNGPWGQRQVEPENASVHAGLGLGLPCDGGSGLKELMMGTPSVFGPKHTTLDFLGLGMAAGGAAPTGGLSALITSIGGGLDVSATATPFGSGDISGKDIGRSS